jgi:WD40 repeat protein
MSELSQMKAPLSRRDRPNDPARRLYNLWRQGERPRVEEFLAQAGVTDPALVVTVLRVDQWERRGLGEWVPAEAYFEAFPTVLDDPEMAIDLVFAEYLLREQLGESPTLLEYEHRFPQFAAPLKLQVELHQAMQEEGGCERAAAGNQGWAAPSGTQPTGSEPAPPYRFKEYPSIPGYEVRGVLGWGGMGMVYRAWQRSLNRMVALKMLHAGAQASPQARARFRVEAEAVARLKHPNIVQIHQVGEHLGYPFLVLELVDGPSLAQSLAGTPQATDRAVGLVETLARAIDSAHRHGVIHRDLTPANILLTADGTPKITDFGLAKLVIGGGEPHTQTGDLLGTPSYMAPEQAAGRHQDIGAATDVYALGAILYDVLTGRPPFKAESPLETLRQLLTDEPVLPSRLRPKLPRDLETICLKCLRKEPAKRYGSALLLADELRRFLDGRPILARPSTSAERFCRWCRRNPWRAGANIVAAFLTTILAVGATVAAWKFRDQRNQIQLDNIRIQRAETETRAALFKSLAAQAEARRYSSRIGQQFASLEVLSAAAAIARELKLPRSRLEPLRDLAIACMALPDLKRIKQWDGWTKGTVKIACDVDLKRYARVRRDGVVSIRNVADDRELFQLAVTGLWPRFSSDGKFLVIEDPRDYAADDPRNYLEIWNLTNRTRVAAYHKRVAWDLSPISPSLAIGHTDGRVIQYDLSTGRASRTWIGTPRASKVAFSPDGRQLAVITADPPRLQIREALAGRLLREGLVPDASDIAWHPDGATVATSGSGGDRNVYLWDVATTTRRMVLAGAQSGGVEVAFSPVGDLLATWSWEGKIRLWNPRTGKLLLSMTGYCDDPVFRSDGGLLVAHDENSQMGLWQVASRREFRTLLRDEYHDEYWKIAIHPAGRLLAAGMESGVGLWDLASGRELGFLPIGTTRHLLFDKSGDLLTRGSAGVWRWPIQTDQTQGALLVGPPRALLLPAGDSQFALDRDGRLMVVANEDGALALSLDQPDRLIKYSPQDDARYVAVSPEGRWVATGSHHEPGVKIWEARDGKFALELPSEGWSEVAFSPDGQWLAAGHSNCRIWSVGLWTEGSPIGGTLLGFSPDGSVLAVETGAGVVRLVDPATGADYARLEAPNQERAHHIGFSPDGAYIALASQDAAAIHVWDLRAIRAKLAAMRLDWDAAPYPELDPADQALNPLPPLQIDVGLFRKRVDRSP